MSDDGDTFLDWLLTLVFALGAIMIGMMIGGIVAVWIEVM